ncbi:1-acyl-sn-glycerol-3-phosphate acyltransferase [Candidatus Uhrbacteria bacterium]|nr:1-acyl-sn-glycerol-3-phosphate acyltransferase [Candidatus Uhrbacteria bacterium]
MGKENGQRILEVVIEREGETKVLSDKEKPFEDTKQEIIPTSELLEIQREKDAQRLDEVREDIQKKYLVTSVVATKETTSVQSYIKSHLPQHLKRPSIVAKFYTKATKLVLSFLEKFGRFKIEGRERIPAQGPCLLVANHTRFFDEGKLAAISGRSVKVIGADMHFDNPLKRFFMRKIGVIEVPATLSRLSQEEKRSLMERVPKEARAYYQKVIARDEKGTLERKALLAFLETTTAALAHGDVVVFFPEGLWTYEGHVLRQAYPGIEFIAKKFKQVTGQDLPIVPVGITDDGMKVAEPMVLEKDQTVHDVMKRVASCLPETARGYLCRQERIVLTGHRKHSKNKDLFIRIST